MWINPPGKETQPTELFLLEAKMLEEVVINASMGPVTEMRTIIVINIS